VVRPGLIFVTGTGTDVGKTHVVVSMLVAAERYGVSIGAYKPIATGLEGGHCLDAVRHARGAEYVPPMFGFERAVSPHLAAREAGRPIDLAAIEAHLAAFTCATLLVEGAGGLFTPLSESLTNADLARFVGGPIILVSSDRLGALHDVLATWIAARALGLPDPLVVLSAPETPDASTGTNASELARIGLGVPITFPRAAPNDARSIAAAEEVLAAIGVDV
jgi:dethiobiotin synthetase